MGKRSRRNSHDSEHPSALKTDKDRHDVEPPRGAVHRQFYKTKSRLGDLFDDLGTATHNLVSDRPPKPLKLCAPSTNLALRDAHARYARYGKELKQVRSVDDLVDLNRREFGSALGGGEHVITGALCGYCSGFAIRQLSRKAAIFIGLGYIGVQYLNYQGYVSVKWASIQDKIEKHLDVNHDGVVDYEDFKMARKRVMEILTFGLPSTAGFVAGFYWGCRGRFLK